MPNDFSRLSYMLQHSPILEKLTLEQHAEFLKPKFGMKGRCNSKHLSTGISPNLKIVKVKYEAADERVSMVLTFLGTFGIRFVAGDGIRKTSEVLSPKLRKSRRPVTRSRGAAALSPRRTEQTQRKWAFLQL